MKHFCSQQNTSLGLVVVVVLGCHELVLCLCLSLFLFSFSVRRHSFTLSTYLGMFFLSVSPCSMLSLAILRPLGT